jgi:hypothetical protein
MCRTWTAKGALLCTVVLLGCGLRSSSVATRPPGQVKDAGAEPDALVIVGIDGGGADRAVVKANTDGAMGATADPWGSIDCQGSEEQINDCIINAPTKSGIPATRSKPTVTYQTCGAQ